MSTTHLLRGQFTFGGTLVQLTAVALGLCLAGTGCGEVFDIHPYDAKVSGKSGINAKNIERIESATREKEVLRFALMGDSQRWYDETRDCVDHINQRGDIDFVIHGGDFSDFGATQEFEWMRDIMERLNVPYVGLIGNHDCIGNGEEIFRKIFGRPNFHFIAGNVLFVALDTNAFEYDYSNPVPDFDFLEHLLADREILPEKTVFAMHARPFSEQFNNNVAKTFENYVLAFPNTLFCLNAHDHSLQAEELFGDGMMYYGCDSMKSRSYLVFTIRPDGYDYEVVYF